MNRITLENLSKIDPKLFQDEKFLETVEDFVYELEAEGSPDSAREGFLGLAEALNKVEDKSGQIIRKYVPLLCALRLISLVSVSDKEKKQFVTQNLVMLIDQPYADVRYWLKYIFTPYLDDKDIVKAYQELLVSAFAESNNLIGDKDIEISTGKVKSLVKNWIYDYNAFGQPNRQRSAIDETNYINQSANAKSLPDDARDLLRKTLRLYDWIRFEALKPRVESEETSRQPKSIPAAPQTTLVQPQKVAPKLSAAPKAPKPKEMTEFEKKLAAISVPTPTAPSVRRESSVKDSGILTDRISEMPKPIAPQPLKMTPTEIKREISTSELPAYTPKKEPVAPIKKIEMPVKPIAPVVAKPAPAAVIPLGSLNEVQDVDDLKKIGVEVLRRGNILGQTQAIKLKITGLAKTKGILPFYTVNAFEQSPLFREYLAHGMAVFTGTTYGGQMRKEEFEAIADLRKEIERL